MPALNNNTAGNAAVNDAGTLRNGDTYRHVLDTYDLAADARIREFVNERALKRVLFHYSYRLCQGTPSSFPSAAQPPSMNLDLAHLGRSGKLTLESISTYGPLNTKLMPDFKFSYANNPGYGREKWDGFGMYNSGGYASGAGHAVASDHARASIDGAAWSLTEILTPLGSRTQITYERDQYANVSEYGAKKLTFSNTNSTNVLDVQEFSGDLTTYIRPGDTITVNGVNEYSVECTDGTGGTGRDSKITRPCDIGFDYKRVPVTAVTAKTITINPADWPEPTCVRSVGGLSCGGPKAEGANVQVLLPGNTEGGDIRVAAVTTLDENGTRYQVRYRYAQPARPAEATSSGVISKLPEFVPREKQLPFYDWYDYPGTSVMYGRVTVLRGQFRQEANADHDQREEYTFYTPVSRMVQVTLKDAPASDVYLGQKLVGTTYQKRYIEQRDNRITVNVGRIGQPIAIEKYNRRGELELSSQFGYASSMPNPEGIAGQGSFTEGVLTSELLDRSMYRINRTTKKYVPLTLATTTTVANGMRTVSQSSLYDFLTGQVLETTAQNSLGDTYVTKTVPAYTLAPYADMGPKGENPANRNMLTQTAGSYVYKQVGPGNRRVVAASAQTWNKDWRNYREYVNGEYQDQAATRPVWRQQESYVWNGAALNADGTYANFADFNWHQLTSARPDPGWLKAGEVLRYDHYSKPLEVMNLNGQYAASKSGSNTAQNLASAANARYVEMAYSGAEDQVHPDPTNLATLHFAGEVREGGRRDATYHHAGRYSSKLSAGQEGFTYRAPVGGAGIRAGRQYRLSVWVHRSDAGVNGGRLYARLNNTLLGEASISSPTTKKAQDWYLLNLYVSLAAGATGQLTVGCRNAGPNPVYLDDFRFHPLQGPMTAYNYDPHTSQLTYVLNNDNLFTRYHYDAAGKVSKVYKETLDRANDTSPAAKLVVENSYNYARMRDPNWVRTGQVECEFNADGSPSGYRRYRRQDVNPRSATYNQQEWEHGEYTADCATCTGHHQKWVNGQCETAVNTGCVKSVHNNDGTYLNTYRYSYSDDSSFEESVIEPGPCVQ